MSATSKSRRQFLQTLSIGGGAALLASCTHQAVPVANGEQTLTPPEPQGPPSLPDGLDPVHFHVHNKKPLALETRRSALSSAAITPAARLFVRNNLPMPDPSILSNRDAWMLTVKGTSEEGSLSLAAIKNLGRDTTTAVLQCSGNGRAFFEHSPSGSQWSVGAAGCVNWTGVRLSRIAELFGGSVSGMKYLTATGGEVLPAGVDPKSAIVERSIPIEKGLNDVLLAWEMNGQPIPITHGGPLRMVVPGYFGCNQIKYVKTIAFTEAQSEAKIQKKGYRFRPLGEGGNPTQPSMWRMPVKSWVNGPGADDTPVLNGTIHFHGVAFSGERGIKGVEVSMDRGKTWTPAELYGPDMGPNAWRTFRFATELTAGTYHIVSRATDNEGDVQPPLRTDNERGYRYNGWTEAGLDVRVVATLGEHTRVATPAATATPAKTAAPREPTKLSEAGERGKAVFLETQPPCGTCHTLADAGATGAVGPSLDDLRPSEEMVIKATANGVGVMPSFKNTLSSEQIADLAKYVFEASR